MERAIKNSETPLKLPSRGAYPELYTRSVCSLCAARVAALGHMEPRPKDDARRSSPWMCHALVFVVETCAAFALGLSWSRCTPPFPSQPCPAAECMSAWSDLLVSDEASAVAEPVDSNMTRRSLVANDFNADFSRRLTFHTWVAEDVVLDRRGLERYLQRAAEAAGLERRQTARPPRARTVEALQRDFSAGKFAFDAAFAAQAHHMLAGAPWAHGRDEFMRFVRQGLRPNHYFLGLGCGPLAAGHHVVRYLLTGRYHCIERDEYLLRAAVEYEIPSKGLIHKRPRFLLEDLSNVAALMQRPPSWLPSPPSYFDFVAVQRPLTQTELEATVTSAVRYLRPRSGRLVLLDPLPARLQLQLGLQPSDGGELRGETDGNSRAGCPFSVHCAMHAYHT